MDQQNSSKKSMMVGVVVALIIGVGGGYLIGKAVCDSDHEDIKASASHSMMAETSKTAELRSTLVALGTAHMDLTDMAIDQALDASPGAEAAKADLINNGAQISAAVGSVYGADAQKQFNDIWNLHLNDFVKYALASKGGDEAGKSAALQDIHDGYTVPISKLLSGANPNLPEKTLESGFNEHIDMTAQMIDNHVKGDYTAEAKLREQSVEHLRGLMNTLTDAIVKQYPSKF